MFLRLRYILRLISTFISRFKGIIIIGLVIGFLIFTIIRFVAPILLSKSVSVIGVTGRYTPDSLPKNILLNISHGLTDIDKSGEISPMISENWVATDNGKICKFSIDQEAKWQDGSSIKSRDIIYNFSDVETQYPNENTRL